MAGLELAHPDDVERPARHDHRRIAAFRVRAPPRRGSAQRDGIVALVRRDHHRPHRQDPSVGGWVANLRDITERKAQEAALNEAQEVFRHAFDDAPIGIGLVGLDGCIQRANRSMAVLLGRTQEELVGASIRDLTHPDDRVRERGPGRERLESIRDRLLPAREAVRPARRINGVGVAERLARPRHRRPADVPDRPARGHHRPQSCSPTARVRRRARLHDRPAQPRRASPSTSATALAESGDRTVAVLFIDLDHFKVVNDSLGHALGDELVTTVAQRLRSTLRPDNVIARFGGDEFVVLCPNLAGERSGRGDRPPPARRGRGARRADDGGGVRDSRASASRSPAPSDTSETLLRHADAAMYRAKNDGRARAVRVRAR